MSYAPMTEPHDDAQNPYDPPMPYESRAPPDYASPPLPQGAIEDDQTPLIVPRKRPANGTTPRTVDNFIYEASLAAPAPGSVALEEIKSLKSTLCATEPPRSTYQSLILQTTTASSLLSSIVPSMRTFTSTLPYLKPAAGDFVVSSAQAVECKRLLAENADALRKILQTIESLATNEEEGEKKETRMRLLRYIKAKEKGERVGQSELAALLLTSILQVDSYAWRWAVERPGVRLARCVADSGDVTFLSKITHPSEVAPSLWSSPWSFVPSLYSPSTSRKVSGYSAAGTKESMPVDALEEETGNYGEPLSEKRGPTRPSRYRLWLCTLLAFAILGGSAAGIGVWVFKLREATASGEGSSASRLTLVNDMPAHPTRAPTPIGGDFSSVGDRV
ncbi:uncharacterized protein JCM15063_003549 [Sporobolomyces koalae]|uniref:uncharacterized protein n=1 Tax=Sporobolomyces koalae TaxID=500713 RepID=UPI00317F3148